MNTVRDAYQPPVSTSIVRKFWLRLTLLTMLLVVALGTMLYTAGQIQKEARIRQMNSNRRPAPILPDTIPDATVSLDQTP